MTNQDQPTERVHVTEIKAAMLKALGRHPSGCSRDQLLADLAASGIEDQPGLRPLDTRALAELVQERKIRLNGRRVKLGG